MALVLLIRHALAETTGRVLSGRTPGVHLSEEGRAQAGALAERLGVVPVAAVYTSPLERCRETVEPLASRRGLPIRDDEDLLEVGYGGWTGKTLRQAARSKLWPVVLRTPSRARFPDGESYPEILARAIRSIERIAAAHRGRAVVVCSHGDVIRPLLAHYAGAHLDLFQRIVVDPASVSAVLLGEGSPRVLKVNDTGSLAALAPPPRPRR